MDPTASAALSEEIIKPVFLGFIDFDNEPMRVNTSGANIAFSGTGDPDLDGFTFDGITGSAVDISPVANKDGGTESITVTLSGLPVLDQDMLDEINDPVNWRGKEMRMWRIIRNAANVQQGGVQHYYTGNMTNLNIAASPEGQTIVVTVEAYLAAYSAASNRTYLDQEKYDAGDLSARAAIAIANNASGGSPAGGVIATGGIISSGGGGSIFGQNSELR